MVLREWTGTDYSPAPRLLFEITYVLRDAVEFGVAQGFVVFGIRPVKLTLNCASF